ncbi:MAG: hypothetical protein JO056_09905 [Alphaproteobacteria bacterium]|nr:hypothetical protein [Alphaproteobacteria bacterium]
MSEAAIAETPPAAASTLRVAVVGHSHIAALMQGHAKWREASETATVGFVPLHNPEYRPPLLAGALNPRVGQAIVEREPDAVLSCVGGNEHNVLGLLNHPVPFDFILPEEPDLPLNQIVDLIPAKIVEIWLQTSLERMTFRLLGAVRQCVQVPVFHLESPPPIPSDEFIRSRPEAAFEDKIGELGVAPAMLRYKLWRLRNFLVRNFVARIGVGYVSAPKDMQDEHGMLLEAGWHNSTHANSAFGEQALKKAVQQIRTRLSERVPTNASAANG